MEELFIPYEQALALKELGFKEECLQYVWKSTGSSKESKLKDLTDDDYIGLPIYSQAFKFFRDKYPELDFGIGKIYNGTNNYHYHINLQWEFFEGTYEESELECLKKLIELEKK